MRLVPFGYLHENAKQNVTGYLGRMSKHPNRGEYILRTFSYH